MAKSKGGFKPEDLKKYYFWIVLPILVILVLVFAFLAKSSIKKAYVEKTTAIKSAKDGADKTSEYVAKFGRARNLGERSRGTKDAGATSLALVFQAFADAVANA